MDYSSLDDVPHSVRMTLQQQHQQHQILSPAFSIVTDSSPQQTQLHLDGIRKECNFPARTYRDMQNSIEHRSSSPPRLVQVCFAWRTAGNLIQRMRVEEERRALRVLPYTFLLLS